MTVNEMIKRLQGVVEGDHPRDDLPYAHGWAFAAARWEESHALRT